MNGLPDARHPPGCGDPPVFAEPWEAEVFAMTLALHEKGLFSWPQWAQALSQQIQAAQAAGDPDLGNTYYRHWMAALESLLGRAIPGSAERLEIHRLAWTHAAARTPHGRPIELHERDYPAAGKTSD